MLLVFQLIANRHLQRLLVDMDGDEVGAAADGAIFGILLLEAAAQVELRFVLLAAGRAGVGDGGKLPVRRDDRRGIGIIREIIVEVVPHEEKYEI